MRQLDSCLKEHSMLMSIYSTDFMALKHISVQFLLTFLLDEAVFLF